MTYEAVPTSVSASPSLFGQYVNGQLPGVREVAEAATNVAELVALVEAGYLTVEAIREAEPELADQVSGQVQARHTANVAAEREARLAAEGRCEFHILAGIDDVPAAMKRLKVKDEAWTLTGDVLSVTGKSEAEVRDALQAVRP